MASRLVLLSAAAAAVAFWLGLLRQSSELRRLGEELEEARRPPPPPSRSPARSSRPMFSALYQTEQMSPLARLQSLPGGTALAAAATLAALALALTLWGSAEAPARPEQPAAELLALQAAVDSVGQSVTRLRDSLRLAAEQATATPARDGRATLARRQGIGAGVVPAAVPLPLAPRLDSSLVPR
jgi:hypothetical protein